MRARCLARAAALSAIDPIPGSRVCVGAANTVDHLLTILAILAAGKVWVPLNPRNGDPELRRIVDFVEPSVVLADHGMAERLAGVSCRLRPLDDLAMQAGDADAVVMGPRSRGGVSLEQAQAIKFTGGTTGIPKGVIQPLRAWNTNIATQIHELGLTPNDRYLVAAPITHGTSTYMLPLLGAGGALIFPEYTGASGLLDAASEHGATVFFAPPTLILSLVEEQRRSPRPLQSLRYLVYGGAPMRPEQIRDAQSVFGPVLCTSFGQTEAPQIITFLPPAEMAGDRLASVGKPSLFTRVAVIDKHGRPLAVGEEGEIAVRGDLVMSGYLKAEEETRKTLVDGWSAHRRRRNLRRAGLPFSAGPHPRRHHHGRLQRVSERCRGRVVRTPGGGRLLGGRRPGCEVGRGGTRRGPIAPGHECGYR